ncbi:MAG: diacylglycerol kinase family lipid kinase [Woeseiaceae bacterium]|nr:diacylglycerol kinase family lipid kinase [Woeseiaceae bacterium]
MRVPLFLNPIAGRGRAAARLPEIVAALAASGVQADVRESTSRGDMEDQICRAAEDGEQCVIVAGGDGSMHEAANGLMHAERETALGLIPVGTGNDFARAAGIPEDSNLAAVELGQRIAGGETLRSIDIGRCNGRFFSNGVGVGIDAKVASIAAGIRLPIGDLVYIIGVIRCLWDGIATPRMTVTVDGEQAWSGPTTLTNVSNGAWVGGQFHIAPEADLGDGQLNVVVAAAVSRARVVALLPKLMKGRHLAAPELTHVTGRHIVVHCDEPIIAHLDGELQAPTRTFDIQLQESALVLL